MDIDSVIDQIDQQHKALDAIYHNAAVRLGMSDSVFWILYMLSICPGHCTQQDLVRQSYFPKQTINTAVAGLSKQGCLELEPIPGTRNQKRLVLTEAGQRLADKTGHAVRAAERRAYGSFTAEELRTYLALGEQINERLRQEMELL